jgi:hypothetical protein
VASFSWVPAIVAASAARRLFEGLPWDLHHNFWGRVADERRRVANGSSGRPGQLRHVPARTRVRDTQPHGAACHPL